VRSALAIVTTNLLLAGCAHAAEWHAIGEGIEGQIHVDMAAPGSAGIHPRLWVLVDRAQPLKLLEDTSWASTRTLEEFDCRQQASRIRATTYYPLPMGQGEPLMSDLEVGTWRPVIAGSTGEQKLKFACRPSTTSPAVASW